MEIKNLSHDTVLTLDVGFPKAINQVHFNNNQVMPNYFACFMTHNFTE